MYGTVISSLEECPSKVMKAPPKSYRCKTVAVDELHSEHKSVEVKTGGCPISNPDCHQRLALDCWCNAKSDCLCGNEDAENRKIGYSLLSVVLDYNRLCFFVSF